MKATIIDTLGKAKKKAINGFGILEIDRKLFKEQENRPVNVTKRCRERQSLYDYTSSSEVEVLLKEQEEEDLDSDAVGKMDRPTCWLYHHYLIKVTGIVRSEDERILLVKEAVMKREKRLDKLQKLVDLDERMQKASRRQPIPEDVQNFVWRRDQGRCVQCGSQEKLEFDHMIPVKKGGSDTARNIQLLCERCNRKKSDNI
jgi:hypothetical protein